MAKAQSVTAITRAIRDALEACFPYAVQVEGEISNYRPHYSGHAYFTLKDEHAQLGAVMWKTRAGNLPFRLEDGKKVVCTGTITVYEKTGRYQLSVVDMQESGVGDLQARFEALKRDLYARGWFDESHKQPLPVYPRCVGIVTSPTGAAIQDIFAVAARRNPAVQLVVRPTQVQGAAAAADIARAIREFNQWGGADVLIVGRGGGSLEDLWAFNEEIVAQAIFESRIPVISAVGHEIDITIADFVADQRAATPSAAAEEVIASRDEMRGQLLYYQDKLYSLLEHRLAQARLRLRSLQNHYAFKKPEGLIEQRREQLHQLSLRVQQAGQHQIILRQQRLQSVQRQLQALNPLGVLDRGFAVLHQDGHLVDRVSALQPGPLHITLRDGAVVTHISDIHEESHGEKNA